MIEEMNMEEESMKDLKERYNEIIQEHGNWTAHNIQLAEGMYTLGEKITRDEYKLRRIVQIVQDQFGEDMSGLRILDLACLEGIYAIEFAKRGAEVVAIEGRSQHVAKVQFAAKVLELPNLAVHQDDVRNLSVEKYGEFDVILCLGILYHIDGASLFPFIEAMHRCCRDSLIIDTHIAVFCRDMICYDGQEYRGINYYEYSTELSEEQKKKAIWASLDNPDSFWPTASSLFNALSRVGFTSVYDCQNPPEPLKSRDRITILAKVGSRAKLVSNPQVNEQAVELWSEKRNRSIHPYQYRYRVCLRRLIDCIPQPAKNALKRILLRK